MSSRYLYSALGLLAGMLCSVRAQAAATFTIENLDEGSGTGLDDSTPATPVGGNMGTTLGQQRLNAMQHALDIWGDVLTSEQPIVVSATFTDLSGGVCDGYSIVLGQAGAFNLTQATSTIAGNATTYHPQALANHLEGEDLLPGFPDIYAEFNSVLDEGCVPGLKWYYGFDGNAGEDEDFVAVVLHEVGHGLGFASYVDDANGSFIAGPDIFSKFQHDLDAQAEWYDMTNAERLESGTNARGLVWTGPNTKREVANFLDAGSPSISVTPAIPSLGGRLSEQSIGPRLPAAGLSGTLVVAEPLHGCDAPTNAAEIAGNIVLVDSWTAGDPACTPLQSQVFMELAGAKAVLSVDPQGMDPPSPVYGEYGDDFPEPQMVPIFQVTVADGDLLANAAGSMVTLSAGTGRVGADAEGRPYLFASNPYLAGSSVSHWDTLARHNLLMEPFASPDLEGTDITRFLMQDIGWGICGDGTTANGEECDDGNATDRDGCSATCKEEVCGDGEVNQDSEECDDGNTTGSDGCSPTCKEEVCGDGAVNQTSETCDDGNTTSGDGCSATCKEEVCGDGAVNQTSEACDDGNTTAGDGCEPDCTVTPGANTGGGGGSMASGSGGTVSGAGGSTGKSAKDSDDDGGCLCSSVGRRPASPGALGLFAAAALAMSVRRRALRSGLLRA